MMQAPAGDREKILEMLTKVDDQFSLSIYKKVYGIGDKEIEDKKEELKETEKEPKR